tara:strand:- start:1718 stop:3832 length:2115 start_codon:yes stop_codon:yes gene_type:complete
MAAIFTEMLLVSSNDYWGHSGSFNSEYNFYPNTFILSQSGYEGLEEDSDRSRFFPCALFYYRGETDNHGFTPATIGVKVENDIAEAGKVQGIDRMGNRERRTYQVGRQTGYSIPGTGLTMMEAPDLNTYAAIEDAADSDELTVQGRFNISDLKYNVDEVVNAINQTAGIEVSEAETLSMLGDAPVGPAVVGPNNPNDYTPMTGPTPEEISAAESHEAVEHMAENGTYTHTTGNYTQDSSQAGHGVPEYYGSGSAGETIMQYDRNEMNEMNAESFGPYEPMLDTATPTPPAADAGGSGYETVDYDVYTETMLAEEDGTVVPGTYEVEPTQQTNLQGWGQGDVVGTIIANYDGTPFGFRAEGDYAGLPGAVDDGFYPNAYGEDSSTVGQGVPQWYGSAEHFEAEGEFTRDELISMVDSIRDMVDDLDKDDMESEDMDDIYQELMDLEQQLEDITNYHGVSRFASESFGLGDYTGPLDNGMGEGSAAGSGNGVPQWYGSAEEEEKSLINWFRSHGPYEKEEEEEAPNEKYIYKRLNSLELVAIAPEAGLVFRFNEYAWQDASWSRNVFSPNNMTEDEYDACYLDVDAGGVFDGSGKMILSLKDDFSEAIFNGDILTVDGDYDWESGSVESIEEEIRKGGHRGWTKSPPIDNKGKKEIKEGSVINMTNGAILVGATVVGALVANFFSGKSETVTEEAGSVKENKGNGQ